MILIDTGYLVALADPRDQHHQIARQWSTAIHETLLVSEYVLLETVNTLSRPMMRQAAGDIARTVRNSTMFQFVPSSPALLEAALALHAGHQDKLWSLTDCASFKLMQDRGITRALAYDQHFEQAGFVAMLRQSPG